RASSRPHSSRSSSIPRGRRRACAGKWPPLRCARPRSSSSARSTRARTPTSWTSWRRRSDGELMTDRLTIARPYARAAFEEAQANKRLAPWSEALHVAAVVVNDPRVRTLLGNPHVTPEEWARLLRTLAVPGLGGQGRILVGRLAPNRRRGYWR